MSEQPYSNREIDRMTSTLSKQIEEMSIDLSRQISNYAATDKAAHLETGRILFRVEEQTKKTNGRVNSLENWRWFIMGGLGVLITLVLPILLIAVKNLLT